MHLQAPSYGRISIMLEAFTQMCKVPLHTCPTEEAFLKRDALQPLDRACQTTRSLPQDVYRPRHGSVYSYILKLHPKAWLADSARIANRPFPQRDAYFSPPKSCPTFRRTYRFSFFVSGHLISFRSSFWTMWYPNEITTAKVGNGWDRIGFHIMRPTWLEL